MLNSTIDYKLIGERIQRKRIEMKITQEQLAGDLNLSTYYISKIENGKATATLDTLSVIASYLNIELGFLITGSSTLEPSYYVDQMNDICSRASSKQLELIIKLAKAVIE